MTPSYAHLPPAACLLKNIRDYSKNPMYYDYDPFRALAVFTALLFTFKDIKYR